MTGADASREIDEVEDFRIVEVQRPWPVGLDHRGLHTSWPLLLISEHSLSASDNQIIDGDTFLTCLFHQLRLNLVGNIKPNLH